MTPEALTSFVELLKEARKELTRIVLDAEVHGRAEAILEVGIAQAMAVLETAKAQLATEE